MSLKISRILHAGYVFECNDTLIAFDPIFENPFSRNCHAFPEVRFDREKIGEVRFAAVFISHFHDDHCSLDSLDLLDRNTPIHLYCLHESLFDMIRALGFIDVQALQIDATVTVGPFDVIARRALDDEVDAMFHIRADGLDVLNVVDAWMDPETLTALAHHAPWDMVLWPFQTMREIDVLSPSRSGAAAPHLPEEWLAQLKALQPRHVVPSSCQFVQESWSWYNGAFFPITYAQFQREVEAALPQAQVVRLNPSVSVTLDAHALQPSAPLAWVVPVGAQDVDYCYDPDAVAPHTADIARRFAALTATQSAHVFAWCDAGLLDTYRALELPEDSYFEKSRVWRLSIYDDAGAGTVFFYRVEGDAIERILDYGAGDGALGWSTDIAISKLHAALELGESLTSMYLRINDVVFDAATENDLLDADIVDDPLIRCLFDDAFGAYQAAQLRRLLQRKATHKPDSA
jgi:L-ascorbate metabolism protein UlaG (beta-lactamase superfamily)